MLQDPETHENPAEKARAIHQKWTTTTWFFGGSVLFAVFIGQDSEFRVLALLTVVVLLCISFYGVVNGAKIRDHLSEGEYELVIKRYGWILGQNQG